MVLPEHPVASPFFFFFNDTATTEIYPLSLHDALPICSRRGGRARRPAAAPPAPPRREPGRARRRRRFAPAPSAGDRKSTRLNSSHDQISYAVFCLKKKKKPKNRT